MTTIPRKRGIVDARALEADLRAAARTRGEAERRAALLQTSNAAYQAGFDEIRRRHEAEGANGRVTAQALAYLADTLVKGLYAVTVEEVFPFNPTDAQRLAVIATGGYGRGELAPYSDLDLLFVYPHKVTAWHENAVEYLLYMLWDLGLKVGQAVRSPGDCVRLAREDVSVRTSLLEMRLIAGDRGLYDAVRSLFETEMVAGTGRDFVEAKLAERDRRHDRMGDSRYVVEPNLKEGKGGLRDLHILFWLTRYLYGVYRPKDLLAEGILDEDELRTFRKAERFLWTVRCSLHFLGKRAEERLTFDVQPELARRLGYQDRKGLSGVERFMKHYFLVAKQVGDLTRVVCAVLEDRHEKKPLFSLARIARRTVHGFRLDGERLTVKSEQAFVAEPAKMIKIFAAAHDSGYDIHPDALRFIGRNLNLIDAGVRRDPEANRAFLSVLTSKDHPEINLRRMNEAGVFGRFVPDFGRVVAQMQYDMYHHFTVDEHTINAIGLLAKIERGEFQDEHPLSHGLIHKIVSRRALYLAVLLHDIAKGRGGDHSKLGEQVARKLCPRLGLSSAETDLVAWLVRWHLLMSHCAFKRDLADRKTIQDFCAQVKSPERLKLLLILTVVDIRAVGPGVWNGWKGQLLRELYTQAEEVLIAGHATTGRERRVAQKKAALVKRLADWPEAARARHLDRFHDSYWIAEDTDTHERNARMVLDARRNALEVGVAAEVNEFLDTTEMAVYTRDRPGLFARLAGAFAASGASVVDAKIHTTRDGMALDNFRIQTADAGAFAHRDKLAALEALVREAVGGKVGLQERIERRSGSVRSRTAVFDVEPMVLIDNRASNRSTVVEVNARDRDGLLYDLTRALSRLRLSVYSAHVATYGERAVDVFYIQDLEGKKIVNPQRLANIQRKLLAATRGDLPMTHRARRKAAGDAVPAQ